MDWTEIRIGTAGWAMPRDVAERVPSGHNGLNRYASLFDAVEINSSFYRPHRPATYARWASSVPDGFRFAVKLPKAISHDAGLIGAESLIDRFLDETANLGAKRGPILVQTPPKLAFEPASVATVAERLIAGGAGSVVWEPRHSSWFDADTDRFLADQRIARVAADPARHPAAAEPGGWRGLSYHRLHGSPRMYSSGYDDTAIADLAGALGKLSGERWVVFDNTALGEASRDAITLSNLVSRAGSEP